MGALVNFADEVKRRRHRQRQERIVEQVVREIVSTLYDADMLETDIAEADRAALAELVAEKLCGHPAFAGEIVVTADDEHATCGG
jgi:hypothetical protein